MYKKNCIGDFQLFTKKCLQYSRNTNTQVKMTLTSRILSSIACLPCSRPQSTLPQFHVHIPSKTAVMAHKLPHTMTTTKHRSSFTMNLLHVLLSGLTIDGEKISIWSDEGHGRMGKVYALTHPWHVVKVSKTGNESHNYSILQSLGIPCAHVVISRDVEIHKTVYSVTVMKRLDFTLTALIRAIGYTKKQPRGLEQALHDIVQALQQHNIAYLDLSPDNIMFQRVSGSMYRLHLIDPQFVVPLRAFSNIFGNDEYDAIYLAFKLYVLGLLHVPCQSYAKSLCQLIMGYMPMRKVVYTFLRDTTQHAMHIHHQIISSEET